MGHRLIHLSSQSVYGEGKVPSIDHPRTPGSFYSVAKMRGEDHVLRLMDKLPVQLIWCVIVYGYSKNLRIESRINRCLFDAHFNNRISIHGHPNHAFSYISLYRTVEILAQIALYELPSDVFNLSHRAFSAYEVIEALRELYPDLETIFVDQHIPRKSLAMACDERL